MCQSHEKLDTTFDLECALKYITRAKIIDPDNKAIMLKFNTIKKSLRIQNKKDKQQFQGLFNRGSIYDDKEINSNDKSNSTILTKIYNVKNQYFDPLMPNLLYCVISLLVMFVGYLKLRST